MRHAKGATTIHVSLEDTPETARIIVADNGSGIPDGAREQVFERFAKREGGGSTGFGIGLALARWVITRHQGRIDITSAKTAERGTQVEIVLPKAAERE